MRILICALAASALAAGAAQAHQAPVVAEPAKAPAAAKAPSRTVYICDESDLTRRSFAREFGSAQFVTAKEAAAAKGETWSAPKCITAAEARRLRQLASKSR
jgi:hypothetical protein